jgi:hypothetical protein
MSHDFAIPGLMPLGSPIDDVTPPYHVLEPHDLFNSLWAGIPELGPYLTSEGVAPAYPAVSARMVFTASSRRPSNVPRKYRDWVWVLGTDLETSDGEVQIMLPAEWVFRVPEQPLPLWHGNWDWVFIVEDSRGESWRTHSGRILIRI